MIHIPMSMTPCEGSYKVEGNYTLHFAAQKITIGSPHDADCLQAR